MKKSVKLYTQPRYGKISLWVDVGDKDGAWNIGDLNQSAITAEVLQAVKHAFELGAKTALIDAVRGLRAVETKYTVSNSKWITRKDEYV